MKRIARLLRWLPARLELEHLRWALREVSPLHPDVPAIVTRINQLEKA